MTQMPTPNPNILSQPIYEPGKPIEDVARELGLDPTSIHKLASNENPWGPSPLALKAAGLALQTADLYPDGGCFRLREALAVRHQVSPAQIAPGNGSNELLELLGHAYLQPGDEVVMGAPAFIVYKLVTLLFGATPVEVPLKDFRHDLAAMRAAVTPRTKIVFLASPNNPTGRANPADELSAFAADLPESVLLVVDEAYAEYLPSHPDLTPLVRAGRPIMLLRTFSKVFGLASLRIGYGVAPETIVALVNRVRQPFNVNAVAQAAAIAALEDRPFVASCLRRNAAGMEQVQRGLDSLKLPWVPSDANFLLVKTGDGRKVFAGLQKRGVIIRPMDGYGMPEWIRVTIGRPEQNDAFLNALAQLLR